jgi:hypothetical protein
MRSWMEIYRNRIPISELTDEEMYYIDIRVLADIHLNNTVQKLIDTLDSKL